MNRDILVIVTAEGCGACKIFKNGSPGSKDPPIFDQIIKSLNGSDIIIKHLNFPSIGAKLEQLSVNSSVKINIPPVLEKYIRWYPILILVNGNTWNTNNLELSVFNGKLINDSVEPLPPQERLAPTPANILTWIKNPKLQSTDTKKIVPKSQTSQTSQKFRIKKTYDL